MQAIATHASEHKALLTELGELDYAPSALEQAQQRMQTLEKDLKAREVSLKKLEQQTRKEYDDWQKVQKSVFRRAALRITGGKDGLEERVTKEEKEWIEALREESHEKEQIATLSSELEEVKGMIQDLVNLTEVHKKLQKRLDVIYEQVFAGPNEEFPEEDTAEATVYALEKEYKDNQARINNTAQAINLLSKASEALTLCLRDLKDANRLDNPFLYSSSWAEYFERDFIQTAGSQASRCITYYNQALECDSSLPPSLEVPDIYNIPSSLLESALVRHALDFGDSMSVRLTAARNQIRNVSHPRLGSIILETQTRHAEFLKQDAENHLRLRQARVHLDATRRAIMLDVTSRSNTNLRLTEGPQTFVREPDEIESGTQEETTASRTNAYNNNPYAAFLASRASTLDSTDDAAPPAYVPRTNQYSSIARN